MKTYVWVSFAFMGWAYYEMSGGADFSPEDRAVAMAEAQAPVTAPEVVTRSNAPTLVSISTSNVTPTPQVDAVVLEVLATPDVEAEVIQEAIEAVAAAPVEPEITPEVAVDIREVASSRVNMRAGPGTNFEVLVTLDGGTALQVLEVDDSGWANVATLDRGIEGWMAERLLTAPDA